MPVKKHDFGFIPSEYQQKIFDFVKHGTGNAVVKAYAGCSKTTTMVSAMQLIPNRQKCLFIAFNTHIVEELKEKLVGRDNCTVMTIHGLGSSIIRRNIGDWNRIPLNEYKYRNYLRDNICELSAIDCETLGEDGVEEYVNSTCELIDHARFNLCQKTNEIKEIAEKYGIPVQHDECEVAKKCMDWGKKHTESIDYGDMIWLPYEHGMSPKGMQFDWVFFDEAQDASKAAMNLFFRVFKRGTRFCVVGDDFQAINQFAGSSIEWFNGLLKHPNTQQFELPICYRCDKKIVELSNKLVPGIKYREGADDGVFIEDCHLSEIKQGDLVLSRSKAPLLRLYSWLIERGVNCYVKGNDIGIELNTIIDSVSTDKLGKEMVSDGLIMRLWKQVIETRNNVMRSHKVNIHDASLSPKVMELYDKVNVLSTIAEKCKTIDELKERITGIFREDSDGICLSTIHKAKGLESDNVFIICRSTMPAKRATKKWEIEQENNLIYVAYTRAKHKLGFINEKEVPPSGSAMKDDAIIKDIATIEKLVCNIYGMPLAEENAEFARFRLKVATNIEDRHANDNVIHIGTKNEAPNNETSLDDLLKELG